MIRAISLHQPWADWVAQGQKQYETRSWQTSYRGWLLIHAAKKPCKGCDLCASEHHNYGAIIGAALLSSVRSTDACLFGFQVTPQEISRGDWSPGRFAWRLLDPVEFGPVPCRGQQGFWVPSHEILFAVRRALPAELHRVTPSHLLDSAISEQLQVACPGQTKEIPRRE